MSSSQFMPSGGGGGPYSWLHRVSLITSRVMLSALGIRDGMLHLLSIFILLSLVFWVSAFIYGSFYFVYMPGSRTISREVNFQFEPCSLSEDVLGQKCSHLSANVSLIGDSQVVEHEKYRVILRLEMPASETNQKAGMFMVCMRFVLNEFNDIKLERKCLSAMVPFKSERRDLVESLILTPFQLVGLVSNNEVVLIEFFDTFLGTVQSPFQSVDIEIQSKFVDVHRAEFFMHAHFYGIRNLLYHHPILSSFIGISSIATLVFSLLYFIWMELFKPKIVVKMTLNERQALARERLQRVQTSSRLASAGEGESLGTTKKTM